MFTSRQFPTEFPTLAQLRNGAAWERARQRAAKIARILIILIVCYGREKKAEAERLAAEAKERERQERERAERVAAEEARFRQSQLDEALAHGRAKEAAKAKRLEQEAAERRAAEEVG